MATVDDNQVCEEDDAIYPFKNNFIDTPWDERSKTSKIGIISLLVAIFAVTSIVVCNNFMLHYASESNSRLKNQNSCHVMTSNEMSNYDFIARMYSVSSKQLMCIGAMLSATAVLADELCTRSGPIIIHVGNSKNPRCRKGFTDIDEIIEIDHGGIMSSNKLIILKSKTDFAECGSVISVGSKLEWKSPAFIIGPPSMKRSDRALKKQPVFVFGRGNCSLPESLNGMLDSKMVICVKDCGRCQVHGGDLLVQQGRLFGLASACVHRPDHTEAYFADLTAPKVVNKIMSLADL